MGHSNNRRHVLGQFVIWTQFLIVFLDQIDVCIHVLSIFWLQCCQFRSACEMLRVLHRVMSIEFLHWVDWWNLFMIRLLCGVWARLECCSVTKSIVRLGLMLGCTHVCG